jgi:DNA-binding PadR family transcriptional regulator
MSEQVLLILLSLAEAPRHGYALLKDIADLSDGKVRLSTGTLYGALHRLLAAGLIERFEQSDTSRDKQAYGLTRNGVKALRAELDRMKQLLQTAGSRLRWKEA